MRRDSRELLGSVGGHTHTTLSLTHTSRLPLIVAHAYIPSVIISVAHSAATLELGTISLELGYLERPTYQNIKNKPATCCCCPALVARAGSHLASISHSERPDVSTASERLKEPVEIAKPIGSAPADSIAEHQDLVHCWARRFNALIATTKCELTKATSIFMHSPGHISGASDPIMPARPSMPALFGLPAGTPRLRHGTRDPRPLLACEIGSLWRLSYWRSMEG